MSLAIAAWSGPRNISTALMRAFENRPDCAVIDEPFYAYYLAQTGLDHPGRAEVLASQPQDWRQVVQQLTGPVPGGKPIYYQKQMCHHLLPGIGRDWLRGMQHLFLIRDPIDVLLSYRQTRLPEGPEALGFPQQRELFDQVRADSGATPPVLDAEAFLGNPEGQLRALCSHLGIDFSAAMLAWPVGPRDSDGVWAPHWYARVLSSTGFEPPRPRQGRLDAAGAALAELCRQDYLHLKAHRLLP